MDEFTIKAAPSSSSQALKHCVFKMHKDDSIAWDTARLKRDRDNLPWQIKVGGGKAARKYKASKEGGVSDNANYYIFYKHPNKPGTFEAFPIDEWYTVSATQRYKTLTAEEAEKRYLERDKTLNFFSIMSSKNKGENSEEGGGRGGHFKITELDDWVDSADEDFSDEDEEEQGEKKKKKKIKNKKQKDEDPENLLAEAGEESDEGDFEQREVDYMSDTSSSDSSLDPEVKKEDEDDVKGIAEEAALRQLLDSGDEEDEEAQMMSSNIDDADSNLDGGLKFKRESNNNASELSSDSDDSDMDGESSAQSYASSKKSSSNVIKQEIKIENDSNSSPSTSGAKRKAPVDIESSNQTVKRPCTTQPSISVAASSSDDNSIEGLIKKYLNRKPMTVSSLLKKLKTKIDINAEQPAIAEAIRKLCDKQKINGATYLSLKKENQ